MEPNIQKMQGLNTFYSDQKLTQYIASQIEDIVPFKIQLLQSFILIQIHFPSKTSDYSFSAEDIKFLILLSKGYPVVRPRIHLKTALCEPSFNDCRDLFKNIIPKNQDQVRWKPTNTLKDVERGIEQFLKSMKKTEDINDIISVGQFHLGHLYSMELLEEFDHGPPQICFSYQENKISLCTVYLTQTHFLLFQLVKQPKIKKQKIAFPELSEISEGYLVFFAELSSLNEVSIDRSEHVELLLTFNCLKPRNLQITSQTISKKLKISNKGDFMVKLIKKMKNFDPAEIKLDICVEHCGDEELKILQQIHQNQEKIKTHLNKETIREMNNSYEMGVEFYSLQNLPYYLIFMDKIGKLYQRHDVKVVIEASN